MVPSEDKGITHVTWILKVISCFKLLSLTGIIWQLPPWPCSIPQHPNKTWLALSFNFHCEPLTEDKSVREWWTSVKVCVETAVHMARGVRWNFGNHHSSKAVGHFATQSSVPTTVTHLLFSFPHFFDSSFSMVKKNENTLSISLFRKVLLSLILILELSWGLPLHISRSFVFKGHLTILESGRSSQEGMARGGDSGNVFILYCGWYAFYY